MNALKRIFADSFVYGLTSYLSVIAAIFLTPIYTRILTKADYGAMDIINTWVTLMVAILPVGLMNAVLRFYPDVKDELTERKKYLSAIVLILLVNSTIFIVLSFPFQGSFTNFLIGDPNYVNSVRLAIAITAITPIYSYNLQLLRVKLKKWSYLAITVSNFAILSTLGFILVYYYSFGVEGFFIASLIGLSFASVLGFILNKEKLILKIDFSIVKTLLNYSVHFLSVFILMQVTLVIDRYLINKFFSLEYNGIYAIAMRIGGIVTLFIGAFSMAWMPYVFKIYKEDNAKEIFKKVLNLYLIVTSILLFGIMIFRAELIQFFAPEYGAAFITSALLAIFNVISGFTTVLTIGIHISKKTYILTIAAIVSIVVNILASILLAKFYGLHGIALGSILGGVFWIAIQYFYSQKYYRIDFDIKYLLLFIVVVVLQVILTDQFRSVETTTIILKSIAFLVFAAIGAFLAIRQFKGTRL